MSVHTPHQKRREGSCVSFIDSFIHFDFWVEWVRFSLTSLKQNEIFYFYCSCLYWYSTTGQPSHPHHCHLRCKVLALSSTQLNSLWFSLLWFLSHKPWSWQDKKEEMGVDQSSVQKLDKRKKENCEMASKGESGYNKWRVVPLSTNNLTTNIIIICCCHFLFLPLIRIVEWNLNFHFLSLNGYYEIHLKLSVITFLFFLLMCAAFTMKTYLKSVIRQNYSSPGNFFDRIQQAHRKQIIKLLISLNFDNVA